MDVASILHAYRICCHGASGLLHRRRTRARGMFKTSQLALSVNVIKSDSWASHIIAQWSTCCRSQPTADRAALDFRPHLFLFFFTRVLSFCEVSSAHSFQKPWVQPINNRFSVGNWRSAPTSNGSDKTVTTSRKTCQTVVYNLHFVILKYALFGYPRHPRFSPTC